MMTIDTIVPGDDNQQCSVATTSYLARYMTCPQVVGVPPFIPYGYMIYAHPRVPYSTGMHDLVQYEDMDVYDVYDYSLAIPTLPPHGSAQETPLSLHYVKSTSQNPETPAHST